MMLENLKKEYWDLCAKKGDIVNKLEINNEHLKEINNALSKVMRQISAVENEKVENEKKEPKDEDSGSK